MLHGSSRLWAGAMLVLLAQACAGSSGAASTHGSAGSPAIAIATSAPGAVMTYRGDPEHTGKMPGPGPEGTPAVAWQFQAGGAFSSSPVVEDGIVYAVSGDGVIHAIALATGTEAWHVDLHAEPGGPLLVGDLLVVGDGLGVLHALAAKDGALRWSATTDGAVHGAVVTDGERVVATTTTGAVWAFDAISGHPLWHVSLATGIARSPAIHDNAVFVGIGGQLFAVDLSDGALRWKTTVAASGGIGTPTVADGTVYAATGLDGEAADLAVVAVDIVTGAERWRYTSPTHAQIYSPAIDGDRAFVVGHDRQVVALDTGSGNVVWSVTAPSEVEALPAFVGDTLYIVGNDGPAMALDVSDGSVRWSVDARGVPYAPVVVDGYLIVGTDLGLLYAIGGTR